MIEGFFPRSRLSRPAFYFAPQALFGPQALLVALVVVLLAGCGEPPPEQVRLTGATMGTRYHITWMATRHHPSAEDVHLGVEAVLEEVNASMSTWRDDSEISRFNAGPPGGWVEVSTAFANVFEMARTVSEASGGAYDVTVAPLVDLWGFGATGRGAAGTGATGRGAAGPGATGADTASADAIDDIEVEDSVPAQEAIDEAMARVGQHRVEFDRQRPALRKTAELSLDFSSIAKGYGVDRVAEWLESRGIQRYLVEVGGEIRVAGANPHGVPWRIAVEKPDATTREVVATVRLEDAAIATSGDYRNFFEVDGVRYSHTIDPRTGRPVRHDLVSVTVIHTSATMADAWATALTVLGTDAALAAAQKEELAVYLISRDGDGFRAQSSPAMAPLLGID